MAELETVGQAVRSSHGEDALRTLRIVAETIASPDFDAAVSQATNEDTNCGRLPSRSRRAINADGAMQRVRDRACRV